MIHDTNKSAIRGAQCSFNDFQRASLGHQIVSQTPINWDIANVVILLDILESYDHIDIDVAIEDLVKRIMTDVRY